MRRRRIKLGENLTPEAKISLSKVLDGIGNNLERTTENISTAFSTELKNGFKLGSEEYFSILNSNRSFQQAYLTLMATYKELEANLADLQSTIYSISEDLK